MACEHGLIGDAVAETLMLKDNGDDTWSSLQWCHKCGAIRLVTGSFFLERCENGKMIFRNISRGLWQLPEDKQ